MAVSCDREYHYPASLSGPLSVQSAAIQMVRMPCGEWLFTAHVTSSCGGTMDTVL